MAPAPESIGDVSFVEEDNEKKDLCDHCLSSPIRDMLWSPLRAPLRGWVSLQVLRGKREVVMYLPFFQEFVSLLSTVYAEVQRRTKANATIDYEEEDEDVKCKPLDFCGSAFGETELNLRICFKENPKFLRDMKHTAYHFVRALAALVDRIVLTEDESDDE